MKELKVFYSFIAAYVDLDEKLKIRIEEIVRLRHYDVNTHVLKEGQHSKYFRFLVSGAVRFYANYDGRDVTTWFELEKHGNKRKSIGLNMKNIGTNEKARASI